MADYTGEVEVGGPWDIRRLPGLTIAKLAVGAMNNNAYLLRCTSTGEGMLIDAANEADRLHEFVRLEGPPVSAVLTTHWHPDHTEALAAVVDDAAAATFAGEEDADHLPVAVDERLTHGETITLGDLSLEIIGLRGHTPGSMSLLVRRPGLPPLMMVGDVTYDADLLKAGHVPGVGSRRRLREATAMINTLRQQHPGLVILPAHDPGAASRLAQATGQAPRVATA